MASQLLDDYGNCTQVKAFKRGSMKTFQTLFADDDIDVPEEMQRCYIQANLPLMLGFGHVDTGSMVEPRYINNENGAILRFFLRGKKVRGGGLGGVESSNGYAVEGMIVNQRFGVICKYVHNPKYDAYMDHEFRVGMYAVNRLHQVLKCFVMTYTLYREAEPMVTIPSNPTDKGHVAELMHMQPSPSDPYRRILVQEYVNDAIDMETFVVNCNEIEFRMLLHQIINVLIYAYRINQFTHNDLHFGNILVQFHPFILRIDENSNAYTYPFRIRIIDYGLASYVNSEGKLQLPLGDNPLRRANNGPPGTADDILFCISWLSIIMGHPGSGRITHVAQKLAIIDELTAILVPGFQPKTDFFAYFFDNKLFKGGNNGDLTKLISRLDSQIGDMSQVIPINPWLDTLRPQRKSLANRHGNDPAFQNAFNAILKKNGETYMPDFYPPTEVELNQLEEKINSHIRLIREVTDGIAQFDCQIYRAFYRELYDLLEDIDNLYFYTIHLEELPNRLVDFQREFNRLQGILREKVSTHCRITTSTPDNEQLIIQMIVNSSRFFDV